MGPPSVLFFDAQFLMEEGSPILSTPTSASSDTSGCSSDVSTAATTVYIPEKPLDSLHQHQHAELTAAVQPTLPRPSSHTAVPLNLRLDTPSVRHTVPTRESRVQETRAQWPYGIDPSRLNKDLPELPKERKRIWRAIRRTVSHLFQRKHPKGNPHSASSHIASGRDTMQQPPNSAPLKPSSASLISPHPRITSPSEVLLPGVETHIVGTELTPAYIRKQQLRRSRSFSGYPNVVAALAGELPLLPDNEIMKERNMLALDDDDRLEDEMDEAAAEAFEILRQVHKSWRFAPLNEDDPAFQSLCRPTTHSYAVNSVSSMY